MTRLPRLGFIAALLACGLSTPPSSLALVKEEKSPLAEKAFQDPSLHITPALQAASELRSEAGARVQGDLASLGIDASSAFYDARAGRVTSFILSHPIVAGDGVGNGIAGARPTDDQASRDAVWSAVRGYLTERQSQLRIDLSELGAPTVQIVEDGKLIQVVVPRVLSGIPVRDSSLTAIINHGNIILLGLENWGDARTSATLPNFG